MKKKIIIIGCMDKFANAVRPTEIKKFLENKNYSVELLNTYSEQKKNIQYYTKEIVKKFVPKSIKNTLFIKNFKKRAEILVDEIKQKKPYAVICENEQDSYVMTKNLSCKKIYDAASPWVDEMYYGGKLTKKKYVELQKLELEIYNKSDYVAFHWNNYTKYVKKNIYNGKNLFVMNWGCTPKTKKAQFKKKPKIVFLGYLKGYWNNIPLLSQLAKLYDIDVYGAPKPPKKYNLNYKGYAPTTDVVADYQFGLITITKDELRKSSFSSKHLEYLAYGLPVLTPNWRKDKLLLDVSIPYDKENFLEQIKNFSDKKKWLAMQKKSLEKSKEWAWENQLKILEKILK